MKSPILFSVHSSALHDYDHSLSELDKYQKLLQELDWGLYHYQKVGVLFTVPNGNLLHNDLHRPTSSKKGVILWLEFFRGRPFIFQNKKGELVVTFTSVYQLKAIYRSGRVLLTWKVCQSNIYLSVKKGSFDLHAESYTPLSARILLPNQRDGILQVFSSPYKLWGSPRIEPAITHSEVCIGPIKQPTTGPKPENSDYNADMLVLWAHGFESHSGRIRWRASFLDWRETRSALSVQTELWASYSVYKVAFRHGPRRFTSVLLNFLTVFVLYR